MQNPNNTTPDTTPLDNTTPNNNVGALASTAVGSVLLVSLGLYVGLMMGGVVFGLFFGMMLSYLILIMVKAQKAVWALVFLICVIVNIIALIILSKFIDLRDPQIFALIIIDILIYTLTALMLFDFCGFKNLALVQKIKRRVGANHIRPRIF
ncbi:hypothetical protein LP090_12635 [Moraxella bovis]|uniref:hypothetical protein n=1 Tax=Moraxella bovis TaxID=476 RepID=UPI0022278666|nr:hypothetical protein [Moraxella bovis]UYZ68610.1 hypothetical protein LP122_00360 [Moraxella bovis]UYZ70982.1 hypothetical protein LP089_00370 [Moraxella bovis]UYZ73096.1 hypothetical protein LP105_12240 [Moraxella bovis]UZA14283.1 hypothetical protein LP102_00350 [Moraxella bovis]UZA27359.1 hypothetical protein LP119_12500 [Moraxella bovis]